MFNIKIDKRFLRKTVMIAVPITLQGLLNTALNMIDTIMIGQLSETNIAAVGLANKVFFVFSLILFGIVSGAGILTAQYWGKREVGNIRRVLGMSLILGISASLIFLIPSIICPELVMRIFTPSADTIKAGVSYLSIVALSYPLTAVTNAYVSLLRGVNEVKTPVIVTTISIGVNVVLNYIFIFGNFGAPKMGVAGAALATLIARIVECVTIVIIIYLRKGPAAAKIKEMVNFNKKFSKKFFDTAMPVIANEFMWGLGVTIYSLAYGRMGDAAVAAITITQTVEQIFLVFFQGLSAATAVILGNEMGADNLKRAEKYANNFLILQGIMSVFMLVICIIIREPIISVFNVSLKVGEYIRICLLVFALYMPFKMFNYINIVGILRSGGDTKASLLLDTTGVWFIGIPLAFIGGLVFKLPIYWVYAMVLSEEIYKAVFGYRRFKKKKWLRNIVSQLHI